MNKKSAQERRGFKFYDENLVDHHMSEKTIFARAPVRICDIGGWTDTWFCKIGAVFNIGIDLYSYVRLIPKSGDKIINIYSENLDLSQQIREYRDIEYNGTLDLLKAAVKRLEIDRGIDIYARSDAPPGCGTGTSASIAVALIGALSMIKGCTYPSYQVAEMAHALETEELGLQSGVQDQYGAAYGGLNYMEIEYPRVKISHVNSRPEFIWQLEQQMILVYLESRSSSDMHEAVISNYEQGDEKTLEAFETLRQCPGDIMQAVNRGDIAGFGEVMNRNWTAQKQLHEKITTERIDQLERIAIDYNALGFKVNGAGGGGSAVILSSIGNEYALRKEILRNDFQILPFKVNFTGLQVWKQE
jgi:D-glycero-alpha-D-manno-heptose-7-phosphate kinase